ncbi:uncharacterized protein LOC121757608 [Salvia splendens]|uniref:uncharacterized protein LOC121757608 n=1 Tax=Salvia splendens TaxID=180675 RepID=UPI001C266F6D|nr:uncharacterized protein LOC121757608 [Salvia splendens]
MPSICIIVLDFFMQDSISENETFSNVADDFPSSPTLDMSDNNTNQEEYQSPVSVLDQFFAEDPSSPSNMPFQSARGTLKLRRLHFEEHKLVFPSQVILTEYDPCKHDQDHTISNYVRLILEASSQNWDQLSAMRLLSQHLLHPSLLDQAQFLQFDPHFDTKLLFDHINFLSPYWPAFAKPRICYFPLEAAVVDEIKRDAQFYLLPQTQTRTLNQIVAQDYRAINRGQMFVPEKEQIILHISEYILEESVLDVILVSLALELEVNL